MDNKTCIGELTDILSSWLFESHVQYFHENTDQSKVSPFSANTGIISIKALICFRLDLFIVGHADFNFYKCLKNYTIYKIVRLCYIFVHEILS